MTDPREKLAALVADLADDPDVELDAEIEESAGDTDPVRQNLAHLARIAGAHRAVKPDTGKSEPLLFEWRHLNVEREIGRGGIGTVYQAWDPILKRRVALKLVQEDRVTENRDRLMMVEAQRMARIRHVNVLAVHGVDVADGRTGIWSDLLRGATLEKVVQSHGPVSPEQALEMAMALADALALIHSKAIVHGDIKPANIMIELDATPVLMDFGAAQGPKSSQSSYGSPLVMAPEQFTGSSASTASDVYGLGATLYFALTGRFPVTADSVEALARTHEKGADVDYADLPAGWRRLLKELLTQTPADRPDAGQIGQKLHAMRLARPRRIKRGAIAGITGLLAAAAVVSTLAWRDAEQSRQQTERVKTLVVDAVRTSTPMRQSGPATVEQTYTRMIELAEERLTDYPAGLAGMRLTVARGLDQLGQKEQAAALAREGIDLLQQVQPDEHLTLAQGHLTLGSILKDLDQLDAAAESVGSALAILNKMPEAQAAADRLVALNHLANIEGRRGDWPASAQAHTRLLARRQAFYGEGSLKAAVDHHNIATSSLAFGDVDSAIEHERSAAQLLRNAGDGESLRMGVVLQGLANAYSKSGQFELAARTYNEADRLLAASMPADSWRRQILSAGLAGVQHGLGNSHQAVEALRTQLSLDALSKEARSYAARQLGDILVDLKDWAGVIGAYRQELENPRPAITHFRPYLEAAVSFAQYQLQPAEPAPLSQIRSAMAAMRASGFDRMWYFNTLEMWEQELARLP